jgi:hypothetical protein
LIRVRLCLTTPKIVWRVLSLTAVKIPLWPVRHPQHSAFGVGEIIWAYPLLEPLPIHYRSH